MPSIDRNEDPVVVIGLACRFPGDATDPENFWDLLCKARSAHSAPDRFNPSAFHLKSKGTSKSKLPTGAHFLRDDVATFDASFFGVNANEAKAMDPQQRVMLEIAYEAFENAGLSLEAVSGTNTSCYVGSFTTDYREMIFRDPDSAPLQTISGTGAELISNRISWFYDLRGPSFTLGTACSSSLVALHQGCQNLRTGESNMAIVGGANLLLNPDMFQSMSNQGFLAEDGKSKSFDAQADGYGRGEGFAAVILKRLSDAVRDGDPIRAVIRGTGVNQDGKTKGITVPSPDAQAELIRSTYRSAGIDFKDTHYCEAHGTGTKVGDPLELEAISKTLGSARHNNDKIIVGSVKPNIGHLEATAGLAGIIKSIFILEHAFIPPNILLKEHNPKIPFEQWKIQVPVKLTPWPVAGLRRLSVQSFGYGGTNAHVILDDAYHYLKERNIVASHSTKPSPSSELPSSLLGAPSVSKDDLENPVGVTRLFVFSAQDQDGVKRQRNAILGKLQGSTEEKKALVPGASYLRDLAFTLGERRTRLAWKFCMTASSAKDLRSGLENTDIPKTPIRSSSEPRIGFIFTGQGAQWAKMGVELNAYPIFRQSVKDSDQYLRFALDCPWSAAEEMNLEQDQSNINLPDYSQPICTILQIALVDLLESWNICPSAVAGHSSGEIAAAYCLGALSKEDALKIAYYRGSLSAGLKKMDPPIRGSMLAVGASESDLDQWIGRLTHGGEAVVACVNSPSSVTVSGDSSAVAELESMLVKEGVFARKLAVDTAYHSPHMEAVAAPYLEAIQDVQANEAVQSRRMFSSVTGMSVDPTELGPMNWVRNLTSPVQFYDAFLDLLRPMQNGKRSTENSVDFLVEVGPHAALKGPMEQTMRQHGIKGIEYRSIISRGKNAAQTALAAAGDLLVHGIQVDVNKVNNYAGDSFNRSPKPINDLPSYSWDHSRKFWSESRISKQYRYRDHPQSSLLGSPCPTFGESERLWRGFWSVSEEPWIHDHEVQGSILYPAAGYIAMAIEAARQAATNDTPIRSFRLRDVQISAPAVLPEESEIECILQLRPHLIRTRDNTSTWSEFTVSSCTSGQELQQKCHGLLLVEYETAQNAPMSIEQGFEDQLYLNLYEENKKLCQVTDDPKSFYKELAALGMNYGPTLQTVSRIHLGTGKSRCTVDIPSSESLKLPERAERAHVIHPATLDGMFHLVFAAHKDHEGRLNEALVPKSIEEMTVSASTPFESGAHLNGVCNANKHGGREVMAEVVMLTEKLDKPVVSMKGFCWATLTAANPSNDEEEEMLASRNLFTKLSHEPAAQPLEKKATNCHFTILTSSKPTNSSQELAAQLVAVLEKQSYKTETLTWGADIHALDETNCISLMELDSSFLFEMSAEDFAALKQSILKISSLLWVTALAGPSSDLVLGLARTIRNEIPGKDFRTLQLQPLPSNLPPRTAEIIGELASTDTFDNEFQDVDGALRISRVIEDAALDSAMSEWKAEADGKASSSSEISGHHPQKLATRGLGMLDALCLEEDNDVVMGEIGADEVEIEVKATGVNFRDVMVAMGQIPDNLLGFEASGTITRVGTDVQNFSLGDNVCTLGHGTHRTHFRNKASLCQPVPEGLSHEEAATLPLIHCTAYYALSHVARLSPGQSVLIHAAAGGVGQAAIQIAKHLGLEIFATVGSAEKRKLIQDEYGVADDHILNSRDLSFARGISRLTNGRGVDCVLNSLSGEALRETWRCIAPFGTFVEIGMKDLLSNTALEMRPFLQDASFTFFNIKHVMTERPKLMADIMNETFELLRRGITRPVSPVTVYPIAEVENAFRLMQTGKHKGKIALNWDSTHTSSEIQPDQASTLNPNASYLLVGGLGGLGRSLSSLLVDLGARNLCFISRSGVRSDKARKMIEDFNERGVRTSVYCCDLSQAGPLAQTVLQCSNEMPPIKGVFQCAMALHDSIFEKMTYRQWVDGTLPKVQGSWNLHTSLPEDLDFHITLSSFVGIFGYYSQSNYAAGGTFQDALAFHRRAKGLKAVTIDLGIMRDVGLLAEGGSTGYIKKWEEAFGIREFELHLLVKKIVASEVNNTGEMPAQIITGFATGGTAQAAKIERPFYFDDPRFSILAETGLSKELESQAKDPNAKISLKERLAQVEAFADAAGAVTDAMVARVAKSLQTDLSEIDEKRPLYTYGIDSLVAVEIADWIFKETKVAVSVFDVLATRPIADFALHLAGKSPFVPVDLRPT